MQCADIPGMPDFFTHQAKPDPEPGRVPMPRRKRLAVVAATRVVVREAAAAFDDLACRAENRIREEPARQLEARDLAAALGVSVQRLVYALAGHARVEKEYDRSARLDDDGRKTQLRRIFYCLR